MGVEEEIVEWSVGRPPWQRAVLRRIARGETLVDADYAALAEDLTATPKRHPSEYLSMADMPRGTASVGEPIRLRGINNLAHVNALVAGQALDFAVSPEPAYSTTLGRQRTRPSGRSRLART